MIEQILLIIGASIFGLLGLVHLLYTFFSNKFHAYDRSVTEAMRSSSPIITKQTTMWRAWVGFNASHSVGTMLLPALYIPLAITNMDVIRANLWFSVLPVILAVAYLILAKQYWFNIPFFGALISLVCFSLAAVLINV